MATELHDTQDDPAQESERERHERERSQLEVPAASLAPGFYTCQINVIDSVSSKFAFPRLVFLQR